VRQRGKVCLARQEAAHPADGILDPAFLPWCIGITEERLDAEAVEFMMVGELGAVVEGDGPPQRLGQACEQPLELARNRPALLCGLVASRMRDFRSCTASTAWRYFENIIRSASQSPWRLRRSAARARSDTGIRAFMKVAELRPLRPRKPRLLLRRGR